ncbi:MAG: redoxin domain-containing protein [Candidatus Eremiobacteraeota bacterium]|nr:redoxin domain-containing protein [Candidatus Eremiobacteraeota bacterium]
MKMLLLFAFALAVDAPLAASAQTIPGPQLGRPAPAIAARSLDGRPVSLSDFRGKVLVLNFWATWCPPCRAETPDMIESYRKLHGSNVAFLGVDSTENSPIIRSFIASKGLPYPVALDNDKTTSANYDVRGIPTTVVIDGSGIVRARFVDVVSGEQLASFVDAAKAGRNAVITSALQRKIDAMLDPGRFAFSGNRDAVVKSAKAVMAAVSSSNRALGQADAAKGEYTDYLKIRSEQAALESAAASGLSKVVKTNPDRVLLYSITGDLATNNENWDEAISAYTSALSINSKDESALGGLAFAYYEKKNWKDEISAYRRLVAITPDPDTYISIGKAYLQLKDYAGAVAATRKASDIAVAAYNKKKSTDTIVNAAYTSLYLGRAYAQAGNNASAHVAFTNTVSYGQQLPRKSVNYAKYTEEGQEADVALGLNAGGKTMVSLAPWTGADLPGSIASTTKYRLVVAGRPGSTVQLAVTGLSKGWLASFCSDKICAPMKRAATMPDSGVKIFEFQLISNDAHALRHTRAQVQATSPSGNAKTAIISV